MFGCAYLTKKLVKNIKSFSIVIFIDDFELYKSIYKLVIDKETIMPTLSLLVHTAPTLIK